MSGKITHSSPESRSPLAAKETRDALSFAWWNTSLAPSGRVPTSAQKNVAAQIVRMLLSDVGADFIALGEVSPDQKEMFRELALSEGYGILNGFGKAGRSRFSMLFLHSSRLQATEPISIVTTKGDKTWRVAQRIDILVSGTDRPVHVFVSHWPNRLFEENIPARVRVGQRLRNEVEELFGRYVAPPNVILLGDYNDEPFNDSLTDWLLSTRDRNLAKRKKHLLYNPFWRYLGAACGSPIDQSWALGGSYYHQDGDVTKWRLFDQMIFSRAFLGGGEWLLDETLTQVVDIPTYSRLLDDRNEYSTVPTLLE